ncbi:MAG: NAD-glutamate dehydrogenase domain-containing protein [Alphaproteobacteria bacterium]
MHWCVIPILPQAWWRCLSPAFNLDDDTILRAFRDVILATQRTDFFMASADGAASPAISIKLDPGALSFVAPPRPFREIYVHSPQVDGIHMRFGAVARGGLRWSDRPQDFRVEVLGLVKAQQVKNAVIVPVGAKGGFFPKKLPLGGSRDAIFEAGRQAYIAFVSRLLAMTDNLDGDTVVPPKGVVRQDGDDPYLVVAADKGTATFSDTANAISERQGFWLGDAFASGGSAGYDHKVMGITARGAWEAVKRHFREMDRDIQREPFTAIGVGDMSGDVFGNGMLLSKATKLIAAFDHRDIFIDPDPDPASSWKERKRLFDLGRSSWQDYNRKLISKGGGIFSRQDKQIPVSADMRKLLGISKQAVRPTEIIQAILKLEADLLWFGGIGTYIRAPHESDLDAGDKANDAIRITTNELKVKVIGEGANLGMTQHARIAYGLAGGCCNSDAIDNSGGVNSSDVEVNIKVALQPALRSGRLKMGARNTLLKKMTGEVADLVLYNNYQQTLAISLAARRQIAGMPDQLRLMQTLESAGQLDREVEDLPDDLAMDERLATREPLTRPELGVLLAYGKIVAFDQLIASDVPDDPYLFNELLNYFPATMRKKYAGDIEGHRLRREIIATQLANALINRCGPTILVRFAGGADNPAALLTRAFAAMRDSFSIKELNQAIDDLDNKISGTLQLELYRIAQYVQIDRMGWALNNLDLSGGLGDLVDHYRSGLKELRTILPGLLPSFTTDRIKSLEDRLKAGKVPAALASDLAMLPTFAAATDIIVIADKTKRTLADAAAAYCAVTDRFRFGRIDAMMQAVESSGYYEQLAVEKARNSLALSQRQLSESLLVAKKAAPDLVAWERKQGRHLADAATQVEALLSDGRSSIARATVAAGMMSELAARMAN